VIREVEGGRSAVLMDPGTLEREDDEPNLRSRSSRDGKRSSGVWLVEAGALVARGTGDGGPSIEEGRPRGEVARGVAANGAAKELGGRVEDVAPIPIGMAGLGARSREGAE
jgi:hypothetical protein